MVKLINAIKTKISQLFILQKSSNNPNRGRTMMIRDRIWNELSDTKKEEQYLCFYLALAKRRKRVFKLLLIIVSVLGLALIQNTQVSAIIFALIVIVEVVKNLIPEIFPDEHLIEKLPEYRMLVVNKFQKLDELWMKLDLGIITNEEATEIYFQIRKDDPQIEAMDNSIYMPRNKKLKAKADREYSIYIENHYGVVIEGINEKQE